jgi:hypothetical protein
MYIFQLRLALFLLIVINNVEWFSPVGWKSMLIFSSFFNENQRTRIGDENHHENLLGDSHWKWGLPNENHQGFHWHQIWELDWFLHFENGLIVMVKI